MKSNNFKEESHKYSRHMSKTPNAERQPLVSNSVLQNVLKLPDINEHTTERQFQSRSLGNLNETSTKQNEEINESEAQHESEATKSLKISDKTGLNNFLRNDNPIFF